MTSYPVPLQLSGNEITDASRGGISGDGKPELDINDDFNSIHCNVVAAQYAVIASSPSPPIGNTYSHRFTVRPGDVQAGFTGGERIERYWDDVGLLRASGETHGDNFYYSWSNYFPAASWFAPVPAAGAPTGWQYILQIFDKNTLGLLIGGPAIAIKANLNDLRIGYRTGNYPADNNPDLNTTDMVLTTLAKDVWHYFVMYVEFRQDTTGVVRIWHQTGTPPATTDAPVYERTGIPTMVYGSYASPDGICALSAGVYRSPDPVNTSISYHGAVRRARTLAAVLPGGTQPPSGSTGIWPAATNRVPNSNATTSALAASTAPYGATTLTRIVGDSKFGSTYWRCHATDTNNGIGRAAIVTGAPLSQATKWIGSAWVRARSQSAIGKYVQVQVNEVGGAAGTTILGNNSGNSGVAMLTENWRRIWSPPVSCAQPDRTQLDVFCIGQTVVAGDEFEVCGFQVEDGLFPTPHIATDGAAGTRAAGSVRARASAINATQSWVAFEFMPSLAWNAMGTAYGVALPPFMFGYGDDATHRIVVFPAVSNNGQITLTRVVGASSVSVSSVAERWTKGSRVLVVAAWTSTGIKISTKGRPFASSAQSVSPTFAAPTFYIGSSYDGTYPLAGDISYFLSGVATIDDTFPAALKALLDAGTEPSLLTGLPGGGSSLWLGDSSTLYVPLAVPASPPPSTLPLLPA